MALKDLLVHIDNSEACTARLHTAIQLAETHDAHLTGLYILPGEVVTLGYAEAYIPPEVLEAQRSAAMARADEAEKAFRSAADKAGLAAEWRFVEGHLASTLSLHARYADLLIIGQANTSDPSSLAEDSVEHVVLDVGRPVLIVPYIGARPTLGENVLVAWNASREAMRAIHDALPLLERAKAVQVLAINPRGGSSGDGDIPSADISLHLARHGIPAEAKYAETHDISVAEMLLSRAADKQVDLIVMGAYGHSRFRELVLGGATRDILRHMTVPVLMSH